MNDTESVRLGDKAREARKGRKTGNEAESCASNTAPLLQIFLSFLKIGAFTFGGGWAMVPLIRKELVDRQGWLEDSEFVDILAIAQSGPGPIAINTSVLCGYKMRGVPGSLIATLGSSLPSFLIILIVANFFLRIRDSKAVEAVFKGMHPAIFGLLISAVWQVGKKSIKNRKDLVFAATGAALLLFLKINPIFAVLIAAISGIIYGHIERSRVNQGITKSEE